MVKKLFIILVILLSTITPVFAADDDVFIGTDFGESDPTGSPNASYNFTTNFQRPSATDNSGYTMVFFKNRNTGTHYLRIYVWTIYENSEKNAVDLESSFKPYMYVQTTNTGGIKFAPRLSKSNNYGYLSLFVIKTSTDTMDLMLSGPVVSSGSEPSLTFGGSDTNFEILNVQSFGNYLYYGFDADIFNSSVNYNVTWGETNALIKAIQEGLVIDYDLIQQIVEDEMQETEDSITDATEEQTEEIGGFFGKLLEGIIEFFTGLFIPDDDFLNNWFTDIHNLFSDKLGILYAPFDLLVTIIQRFMSIESTEACMILQNCRLKLL